MKILSKITLTLAAFTIAYSGISAARNNIPCDAHTWHHIHVSKGKWEAVLQPINEVDHLWFIGSNCSKVNSLEVNSDTPQEYGLNFDDSADFNMVYTLSVVEQSKMRSFMTSRACVFVITAKGPAIPDVHPIGYNNTKCEWQAIPGVGEDFFVE